MKHWMHNTIQDALTECLHVNTLDKECLLAFVLHTTREHIVSHPEERLSPLQSLRYRWVVYKRMRGIPLAYLTKEKAFFGLAFLVTKHTLIPRPETELMVEEALKCVQENGTLIDVGVGTGCVPIAIAKTAEKQNTHLTLYGTDISTKAIDVAKKNAQKHGVSISFHIGNLLQPIIQHVSIPKNSPTFITANLPYITEEQFDSEKSIAHEPKHALVAQDNGLALYKELLGQIKTWKTKPKTIQFFFEIDPTQIKELHKSIRAHFPKSSIQTKQDLAGHDRLVYGTIK